MDISDVGPTVVAPASNCPEAEVAAGAVAVDMMIDLEIDCLTGE